MTRLFFQRSVFVVVVSAMLILLTRFFAIGRGTNSDLLAYTVGRQPTSLMLYDFSNDSNKQIFSSSDSLMFSLSDNGRLAYASRESGEIYVLDTRAADPKAINITQTPTIIEVPLAWSHDSRYLAFVSSQGDRPQLYIWDGEATVNITPNDMADSIESYQVTWSDDGRLAFTVRYGFNVNGDTEIYIWDGKTTTNLSQNPIGEDSGPVWSEDGRLAFLSTRDGQYNIFVWDGLSFRDGSPDIKPFIDDPSALIGYYSFPNWIPDGHLTFISQTAVDTHTQIYVWDGQAATNISQNPNLHNGIPMWSDNGHWAFVTYFSPQQLLYVRDAGNRPLLTTEAQYSPAWSPNGLLVFCKPDPSWTLAVWDGQQIVNLVRNREIRAEWGNGNSVACSSG